MLELSSTFCNRWSDLFCKRFVLYALCYTARCFINLSRRFREDCGTSCVTDYTVYQDLVMDTSVYLVSYDGLVVKTTTQSLFLFFCVFIVLKKTKIKNLADLVPACRVVFTLSWVEVFLLFLINIPTLKSWFVYLRRHHWCRHLTTLMIWPFALKWRWHNEGGESLLPMPPRFHSTTS